MPRALVKWSSLRNASLAALLFACGARTGVLGETEQTLVPDASVDAAPPKDAGHDAPVFDARADTSCDACVRLLTYDNEGFYEIHAPEGTIQTVGPRPDANLADIALTPDKKTLYGASYGELTIIDMSTWKTKGTLRIAVDQVNALEVGPDGTIYGAEWDALYAFLADGKTKVIGSLPDGLRSSGDLAFAGPRLFATVSADNYDGLVEVDLPTKTTRVVGPTAARCIFGLVGAEAVLYGVTCDGDLVQIDVATAETKVLARALVNKDSGGGFLGATRLQL
jgi:hypothetical protein